MCDTICYSNVSERDLTAVFLCIYGLPSEENLYKFWVLKFCILCLQNQRPLGLNLPIGKKTTLNLIKIMLGNIGNCIRMLGFQNIPMYSVSQKKLTSLKRHSLARKQGRSTDYRLLE